MTISIILKNEKIIVFTRVMVAYLRDDFLNVYFNKRRPCRIDLGEIGQIFKDGKRVF